MRARPILSMLAVAAAAITARAQFIMTPGITASLDLAWQEDSAFSHNDNGVLEPGEHALILMSVSFTGQFTRADFLPSIGPYTSGTILGLATAYIDIRSASADPSGVYNIGLTQQTSSSLGPNANDDGTFGYGVRGGWRLGGNSANGTLVYGNSWGGQNIGPGQLPSIPSLTNATNPITNLYRMGWAPASYSDRSVVFTIAPAAPGYFYPGLYMDFDGVVGGVVYLYPSSLNFGSVNIPIVPAPAGLGLIGIGGLLGASRRRRSRMVEGAGS